MMLLELTRDSKSSSLEVAPSLQVGPPVGVGEVGAGPGWGQAPSRPKIEGDFEPYCFYWTVRDW